MQTVYARCGSRQRQIADVADVVFTDTPNYPQMIKEMYSKRRS